MDALAAFDDQCTVANPRYPLISELRRILLDSFYGKAYSGRATEASPRSIPKNMNTRRRGIGVK